MHWVTDCFCICKKNRSSLACGWAKQLSVLQVNSIFLHFSKWVQALLCFSGFLLINNEVNSTLCFMVWELFFGRRAQGYLLSPWIIPTFCAAAFCEICYCFFSALNMHDGLPKLTSVCMYVHECLCVCLTGSLLSLLRTAVSFLEPNHGLQTLSCPKERGYLHPCPWHPR